MHIDASSLGPETRISSGDESIMHGTLLTGQRNVGCRATIRGQMQLFGGEHMTQTRFQLAVGILVAFCSTFGAYAQQQTAYGEKVKSPAARTQPCYRDDCADRRLLTVTIPVGATYVATHYFTNADVAADRGDVYETGPGEVAWGHFSIAAHAKNDHNQEVVTVYYFNRSNRDRLAAINVDYLP